MLPSPNKWVVCFRPNPQARLRLFCFPYAGGSASAFRTWWQSLPAHVEVCSIQLPGRESRFRETPFTEVGPMAQALADVLAPYLDRPFAIFGHSMGAIIGFELARQLRREHNQQPVQLFVSGRIAPHAQSPEPPIHALPEATFIAKLRELNGTPDAVLQDPELRRMLLPVLRADLAVNETYSYTPEPPLEIPIAAYGGLRDPKANEHDLRQWAEHTRSAFTLRMFPGDHFFLHSAQTDLVRAIAEELVHC